LYSFILYQSSGSISALNLQANPDCPCIDADLVHIHTNRIKSHDSCLDAKIEIDKFSNIQESFCYPEDYGVGCSPHDFNIEPFCDKQSDLPDFCSKSWCYVDQEKCKSSTMTYAKSAFFPGDDLFYSYDTCGFENTFKEFSVTRELKGRTLKVGIPALFYPDHYRLDENGDPIFWSQEIDAGVGDLLGIYPDYIRKLAIRGDFKVEFRSVSPGSYVGKDWTSWTGCVIDVGNGILDMCAGNFWETSERRSIVHFTTSFLNEMYFMMVPKPKPKQDLLTELGLIFKPFTTQLWFVIASVTFLVGITYTVLGSHSKISSTTRISGTSFHLCISNTYFAWTELVQGADKSDKKTVAQRSLALSWSFFILIIVAAYTANLAAFLGSQSFVFDMENIDDCLNQDCLMCHTTSSVLNSVVESMYPSLRRESYDNVSEALDAMKNGHCDALMLSEYNWNINKMVWRECETTFIGKPLFSFKVGWPISDSIAKSLSFFMSESLDNGEFTRVLDTYTPPQNCNLFTGLGEIRRSIPQLTVAAMAGPLIILSLGIVFGLVIKFGFGYGKEVSPSKASNRDENICTDSFRIDDTSNESESSDAKGIYVRQTSHYNSSALDLEFMIEEISREKMSVGTVHNNGFDKKL